MNCRKLLLGATVAMLFTLAIPLRANDTNGAPVLHEDFSLTATNYWSHGVLDAQNHDWDSAATNFKQYLSLNPGDAKGYEYLADVLFFRGDLNDAEINFNKAIQLAPNELEPYVNRGNLYRAAHKYKAALVDFTKCIQNGLTNAYASRASVYASLGDYTNALADATLSLRYNGYDPAVADRSVILVLRGDAYVKLGRYGEAIDDYKQAVQFNPTNAAAHNEWAWLLTTCPSLEFRNLSAATGLASNACRLTDWKQWESIDTLSAACAGMGDYKSAVEIELKALRTTNIEAWSTQIIQSNISLYMQKIENGRSSSTKAPVFEK